MKYSKRIESTNNFLLLKSFIMGYTNVLLLRLRIVVTIESLEEIVLSENSFYGFSTVTIFLHKYISGSIYYRSQSQSSTIFTNQSTKNVDASKRGCNRSYHPSKLKSRSSISDKHRLDIIFFINLYNLLIETKLLRFTTFLSYTRILDP